jgi:hypothetical protein
MHRWIVNVFVEDQFNTVIAASKGKKGKGVPVL